MNSKISYPLEPFIYKTIKPIHLLSRVERIKALKNAHFNLFKIPAEKVTIDFLTDSGTGAMSEKQWSALMIGDETYANATSWNRFEEAAKNFSGMHFIIPAHQGRAAEKIIAEVFLRSGDIAVANTFFDTTRANFEHRGALCIDIPTKKSSNLSSSVRFKGDIDTQKLKMLLQKYKGRVKLVVMTLTNNSGGGQPASLQNIQAVSSLAKKHKVLFLIDACRIAENAYFIWRDELKRKQSIAKIVRRTFSLADMAHMSAKKDGLSNMGGFIATNKARLATPIKELVILYEGFTTYGGMSGRDLETVAEGLKEVTDEKYLTHRVGQVAYLHRGLKEIGFPLISPPGGHAVYIDAGKLLPHIPKSKFPGQALVAALYEEGGIRSVEIGSLMFAEHARHELVRLAIPRRVYTQSHFDYVIDVCKKIIAKKKQLKGFQIIWEPKSLRHFSLKLEQPNVKPA